MKIVAFIIDYTVVDKILRHLLQNRGRAVVALGAVPAEVPLAVIGAVVGL